MSGYTHIQENGAFSAYLARLRERGAREIAIDIEGEFNLHVYGERFCLLQLYDGIEEVVVDPSSVSIDLIRGLLENRDLLKITYDCASDRTLLAKAHGIVMSSILDLRPAVEILEYPRQDLTSVLERALGVQETGSKKRFQQYNWTRRPVDAQALEYALKDVRHLFTLKDALLRQLVSSGTLERFILENLKRQDRAPEVDRQPGVFRSGRFKRMNAEEKRAFSALHEVRERYARELDLPPNTVVANDDLYALAARKIRAEQIRGNRRVPPQTLDGVRRECAAALAAARPENGATSWPGSPRN